MRDVGRYVEGCDLYQRIKNRMEELVGKLKLSEYRKKLWVTSNSRFHYEVISR